MKLITLLVNKLPILFVVFFITVLSSCKKDPGSGGTSTIYGQVHVTDYNSSFTVVQGQYDAPEEDVYIIYGDNVTHGDKTETRGDGKFEFRFLREGNYTIYVYSDDATLAGKHAVSKTIEITNSDSRVDAGTFEINKQ